jgi:site-specific DNA recombinase
MEQAGRTAVENHVDRNARLGAPVLISARWYDSSIRRLIDLVTSATNAELIPTYEARLVDLQRQKTALVEKIENAGKTMPDFDATLRTAITFLASPWKLWETGKAEDRRAVRKLVFTENLQYTPELGFRTAETTLPFKVLGGLQAQDVEMVGPEGLEPPTKRL